MGSDTVIISVSKEKAGCVLVSECARNAGYGVRAILPYVGDRPGSLNPESLQRLKDLAFDRMAMCILQQGPCEANCQLQLLEGASDEQIIATFNDLTGDLEKPIEISSSGTD